MLNFTIKSIKRRISNPSFFAILTILRNKCQGHVKESRCDPRSASPSGMVKRGVETLDNGSFS